MNIFSIFHHCQYRLQRLHIFYYVSCYSTILYMWYFNLTECYCNGLSTSEWCQKWWRISLKIENLSISTAFLSGWYYLVFQCSWLFGLFVTRLSYNRGKPKRLKQRPPNNLFTQSLEVFLKKIYDNFCNTLWLIILNDHVADWIICNWSPSAKRAKNEWENLKWCIRLVPKNWAICWEVRSADECPIYLSSWLTFFALLIVFLIPSRSLYYENVFSLLFVMRRLVSKLRFLDQSQQPQVSRLMTMMTLEVHWKYYKTVMMQ